MRSICAPVDANNFMRKYEKLRIYSYIRNISTFYCGFMDYIFFLWNGTKSELKEFIANLNKKHPFIKLEFTHPKTNITFLENKIYKNQNGILCTTICRKPNDHHNFLHIFYKSGKRQQPRKVYR